MIRWFNTAVNATESSDYELPVDPTALNLKNSSHAKKRKTYEKPTKLDLLVYEPNLPNTIITSRTELLTDVKIANISHEFFKAFQRHHCPFRVEWVYPRPEEPFYQL